MPQKVECNICHLVQCTSVADETGKQEPWRLEHVPWMPWVFPRKESIAECPVCRDPQKHQREINRYKLPIGESSREKQLLK